jgi:large subunit ribosomal protein L10
MALTKVKKAEKVALLAKELEGSTSAIVGSFAKLTVAQDFALRSVVRTAGGRYRVLKNKLAARASKGTGVEAALQNLKGVSSVAYTSGDPVALAKALSTWVKDNSEFTFKLGIVEGKVITVAEVAQLATMPGKEELYSKLLFLINSPAQRLATVIAATGRDLAVVLNQGVEKEKFAGAAAPVVAAAAPVEVAPVEASVPAVVEPAPAEVVAEVPAEVAPVAENAVLEAAPEAESRPNGPSANEQASTEDPVEGRVEEAPAAEAEPSAS